MQQFDLTTVGSDFFPLYLKGPYLFAETIMQRARSSGQAKRALDICCGSGLHSFRLVQLGFDLHGVDISDESIQKAKQFAKQAQLESRTFFEVKDVSAFLDLDENSIDFVFVSGSLYYLNGLPIYREIKRVLKPGGMFCFIETNGDNFLMNTWRRVKNKFTSYRDQKTITSLLRQQDVKEIKQVFSEAQMEYFGFFVLAGVVLKRTPFALKVWYGFGEFLDCLILNKLRCHVLAFKWVMYGINKK